MATFHGTRTLERDPDGYENRGRDYAGRWNAELFEARGDGSTDDRAAIQEAIDTAAAQPYGGEVFVPPGIFRIRLTSANRLTPKSNVVLRGAGMGRTVLWMDDSGGSNDGIGNLVSGTTYLPLTNWRMEGLTLKGRADVAPSTGAQLMHISGTDITLEDCEFTYSRNFGLVVAYSNRVLVRGCKVFRTVADGIAVWATPDARILGNSITGANDDAISAHSNDDQPAPVRSGLVISENTITESQGIAVAGAKLVQIHNNNLRRIMGSGIRCNTPAAATQGGTAQLGLQITSNLVADVFLRSEPSPRNPAQFYIRVEGGTRRNGAGSAPPGEPASGSGTVESFYGSATGTLWANNTDAPSAQPAGQWLRIENNTLIRTLPAVSTVSQWGYGSALWVGSNGDGTGFYNGAIAESALQTYGIVLALATWNARIAGNTIQTSGPYGIFFNNDAGMADLDYADLDIERNMIRDCGTAGIGGTTPSKTHRIRILRNHFDIDPFFRHALRAAGGTWSATTSARGITLPNTEGVLMDGNSFRNCSIAYAGLTNNIMLGRVLYCDPAAPGYSASNKGIGDIDYGGPGVHHVIEDCDPTSATFGKELNRTLIASGAMPSTGKYVRGHQVHNVLTAVAGYSGWVRLTTGSGHVLGTDWGRYGLIA